MLEYKVAFSRGSGMEFVDEGRNYLLAAKVSTARTGEHAQEWIGLSALLGDPVDPMATMRSVRSTAARFRRDIVRKRGVGIDFQKLLGPVTLRGEISWGQDSEREDILALFAEVGLVIDKQGHLKVVAQSESFIQDFDKAGREEYSVGRLGLVYTISAKINLQFLWAHDFDTIVGRRDDTFALAVAVTAGGGLFSW